MIYYIIGATVILVILFIVYRLLQKSELKYDYFDVLEYNRRIRGTGKKPFPLPPKKELKLILRLISSNKNDLVILNMLNELYEPFINFETNFDVSVLAVSELLYHQANKSENKEEELEMHRASRLMRRCAHSLYRKYRSKKPNYSNPKFLQ